MEPASPSSTATTFPAAGPSTIKRPTEDGGEPEAKRVKTDAGTDADPSSAPPPDAATKPTPPAQKSTKKKDRIKGRRKRSDHDEAGGYNAPSPPRERESGEVVARLPKRACALLIGFCGSGYSGMQIQQNARTIENTLFDALVRVGAVSKDNADDPMKIGLARAARTDAGVHAAGNVVAAKLITQIPGVEDFKARVNEELPPEIRLWECIRVQNSFNPRTLCDSRKYTYFFPSYLLIPPKPTSAQYRVLKEHAASLAPPIDCPFANDAFWAGETGPSVSNGDEEAEVAPTPAEVGDMARKRSWRAGAEQMAQLRAGAQRYIASHNFHNFTVNGTFMDRSNQRIMKAIEIADPVVYGETEWISVLFHGQSFMMHQIRKMIAVLVLIARTSTPPEIIDELYGPRDIFIPKMPALGLLLEQPLFHSYNTRVAAPNEKLPGGEAHADYRPPIDFEKHKETMEAFKEEWIYKNMRMVEERDGLFDAWVRMVDAYGGTDFLWLNPRGTIPAAAVIQPAPASKGKTAANASGRERYRKGGFREKRLFDATSFPVGGTGKVAENTAIGDGEGMAEGQEEDAVGKR
ncbi:PseudoU-synth-1 domain-containing protein [Mycena kentingensis (nom. inval.)]|nr:PseudoU-synth-1 domain-containing protein [Mycena kentingensis (nom. inval.)]